MQRLLLQWATTKVLLLSQQDVLRWRRVLRDRGRWLIIHRASTCLVAHVEAWTGGVRGRQFGERFDDDLVRACSRLGSIDHRGIRLLKRWYWPFTIVSIIILGRKRFGRDVLCGFESEGQGLMRCAPLVLSHLLSWWKCLAIWCTIDWGGRRISMFFECETATKRHLYIFLISNVRQRRELLMIQSTRLSLILDSNLLVISGLVHIIVNPAS